ncbi:MAG TPA: hypothetical protein VF991_09175 [Reyranella sp.]
MTPLSDTATSLVASLNQRHNRLAASWVSGSPSANDARALVTDIVAAGAVVPDGPERDSLRNLLYFWCSEEAVIDAERGTLPRLDAFRPQTPETHAAAPSPPADAVAASAPAAGGGIGATVAGVAEPVLRSVMTGMFKQVADRLRSTDARKDQSPPSPSATSPAGPPSDAEARAIVRISALARQWRMTDEINKRGYLLTGKALAEASLFMDRDPEIKALVTASEKSERFTTWVKRGLVVLAFVALASLAYLFKVDGDRKAQVAEAEVQVAKAEARAATELTRQQSTDSLHNRATVQTAVDALSRDDLDPLKRYLESMGANRYEVSRLQLQAATPVQKEVDATVAPPQRTAPPQLQVAAAGVATCSGYLWFGSKSDSRLANDSDPALLKSGESVVLDARADIRLRAEWPPESYVMPRQVGLVPAGGQVTLSSDIRTYRRSLGDQIWAQVTVPRTYCSTVFLQYVGPTEKRRSVIDALRAMGVQAPPSEQIASAKGLAEARYFFPEDKPVAEQVATTLSAFNGDKKLGVLYVANVPVKPSPGTIEVWLDLNR